MATAQRSEQALFPENQPDQGVSARVSEDDGASAPSTPSSGGHGARNRPLTRRTRRLAFRATTLSTQLILAFGLVLVATFVRLVLGVINPRITAFAVYYPAILLASLLGGWRSGTAAVVGSTALAWLLFIAPRAGVAIPLSTTLMSLTLSAGCAFALVALTTYVTALSDRLNESERALLERNMHYDILFQTMSEGFALCEAIRDDSHRLVDYVVLDMNPALQQMLGVGPEAIGGKLSAAPGDQTAWLALCHRVLTTGKAATFEYHNATTGRWHEVHVNRVTSTRMAQFFFDVTERKMAEAWQAKLFDELNHRVSNNLTIVSGVLRMQAGRGDAALRTELLKAVDRVKSIADVHGSLYQGNSGEGIEFGAYLETLCERLSRSLLADDRIRIQVEADPGLIAIDHAVPLGMLVNELVTNAVKYAYPAPGEGVVRVCFQKTEVGAILSVSDTGRGLPETFEAGRGGLGMTLVGFMTQQVGGNLTIRRDQGTTFEVRLEGPASMKSAGKHEFS